MEIRLPAATIFRDASDKYLEYALYCGICRVHSRLLVLRPLAAFCALLDDPQGLT